MQENNPREVELDFSSNEEHIDDLKAAREELSDELIKSAPDAPESAVNTEVEPFTVPAAGAEYSPAAEPVQPAPETEKNVVQTPAEQQVLRSRQPMNRPAGTPPLEEVHNQDNISFLEKSLAGKSYGTALRMLREHHNLSYEDLDKITRVQPRYLEALEKEDLSQLPPLVYVIAYIRGLGRYYKISNAASDMLVEQLKSKLQYSCNDEFINSLDIDHSGQEANERKLKQLIIVFVSGLIILVAAVILLVVMLNSSGKKTAAGPENAAPSGKEPAAAGQAGEFDPNTVYVLLEPPTLDLPRLPAGQ